MNEPPACSTPDIRPKSSLQDLSGFGARQLAIVAPSQWLAGVEDSLVPMMKECLATELEEAEVEANNDVMEAEDEEEDTTPQRIAVDPGQPTIEEVEEHTPYTKPKNSEPQ